MTDQDAEKGLSYKAAGVDIDAADEAVRRITPMVESTYRDGVLSKIGAFAGFFKIDLAKYPKPVMVSGTDGVGTKLKVAQMAGIHHTVGIDLVAMCVNDILVHGAEPLFFLDYLAVGEVQPVQIAALVEGVSAGCRDAGCALIGGETAEMPGFYGKGEYDMAGFAVGVVNEDKILTGAAIQPGDVAIGLASSGLHSNGFSLARKIFFDKAGYKVNRHMPELGRTLAEELLTPTRIYVKSILGLLDAVPIKGLAHITGGGLPENLVRVLPSGVRAQIRSNTWERPAIFDLMAQMGRVEPAEMFRTFNMGLGMIVVVDPADVDRTVSFLTAAGEKASIIGEMTAGEKGVAIDE